MNKKGFTIIELVVVIAIIAVLAAIVLINVSGYINKGTDAKMKETMHTLQVDAIGNGPASGGSYAQATTCPTATGTSFGTLVADYTSTYAKCIVSTDASTFCACARLKSDNAKFFCVDSTGASRETTTCLTACGTANAVTNACP